MTLNLVLERTLKNTLKVLIAGPNFSEGRIVSGFYTSNMYSENRSGEDELLD